MSTNEQKLREAAIRAAMSAGNKLGVKSTDALRILIAFEVALTQPPAPEQASGEQSGSHDWMQPTSYLERFHQAMTIICRAEPPIEMVEAWLDKSKDDHRLQEFAIDHSPRWAQGIGLLDAAHIMADQPTEGVDHEMRDEPASTAAPVAAKPGHGWSATLKAASEQLAAKPETQGELAFPKPSFKAGDKLNNVLFTENYYSESTVSKIIAAALLADGNAGGEAQYVKVDGDTEPVRPFSTVKDQA